MKTRTVIIVGGGTAALVLLLLTIVVAGGYYYLDHKMHEPTLRAKLDKAWDDGDVFGKTTDQDGCMTKALSFVDSPDKYDLSNYDFGHACFSACRPSQGFCDGVSIYLGEDWADDQCPEGRSNREACISAFENKQSACRTEKLF